MMWKPVQSFYGELKNQSILTNTPLLGQAVIQQEFIGEFYDIFGY